MKKYGELGEMANKKIVKDNRKMEISLVRHQQSTESKRQNAST